MATYRTHSRDTDWLFEVTCFWRFFLPFLKNISTNGPSTKFCPVSCCTFGLSCNAAVPVHGLDISSFVSEPALPLTRIIRSCSISLDGNCDVTPMWNDESQVWHSSIILNSSTGMSDITTGNYRVLEMILLGQECRQDICFSLVSAIAAMMSVTSIESADLYVCLTVYHCR